MSFTQKLHIEIDLFQLGKLGKTKVIMQGKLIAVVYTLRTN